tara:strand:+ start:6573 stop:6890 length:318 start_codon:yes stop_codon:yes gene_type:complete
LSGKYLQNKPLSTQEPYHIIGRKKIMEFEISSGIPLPRGKGKPRKYDLPLDDMEVGDHCHIGMPKTKIAQEVKIIRNFVLRYRHKNPSKKFTVRQMEDGVGIWRL